MRPFEDSASLQAYNKAADERQVGGAAIPGRPPGDRKRRRLMADHTYIVEVAFSMHEQADEYLQGPAAIHEQFKDWLENLGATVHYVTVRPADERKKGGDS
jgi:hypothetical protein